MYYRPIFTSDCWSVLIEVDQHVRRNMYELSRSYCLPHIKHYDRGECLRLLVSHLSRSSLEILQNYRVSQIVSAEDFPRITFLWQRFFDQGAKTKANVRHCPLGWLIFERQSRGNGQTDSNPTAGGVQSMQLYAHRRMWRKGTLDTKDIWPRSRGVWTEQLVTGPQWVVDSTLRSAALRVEL